MSYKQVINGKVYNTETAEEICELPCSYYGSDFNFHLTHLYRTLKGAYFLAGKGGPMSMWAEPSGGNGRTSGSGIRVLDAEAARGYAESANLNEEEMIDAGFEVEEA